MSDGKLGEAGGVRPESNPRREATVGDKNAPDVADWGGGLSCEYAAVDCKDRLGFRLACILAIFEVAWPSISNDRKGAERPVFLV